MRTLNNLDNNKGIRRKLLLSYLAIIIPLIAISIISYYGRYIERRQDVLAARQVVAQVVAANFDHLVKDVVATERAIGIAIEENDYSRNGASSFLSRVSVSYPVFSLDYVKTNGEIFASSDRKLVGRKMNLDLVNLDDLSNGKDWLVSPMHVHENGEMGFDVVTGVWDGSELAAVVVASVDATKLDQYFAFQVPGGGYNIVDNKGIVVFQSQNPKLAFDRRDWQSQEFIKITLAGREYISHGMVFPVDDSFRMGAQVPIESIGWSAGSFLPVDEVISPIFDALLRGLLVASIIALLAVILGLGLGGRIVRPITSLAEKARLIAKGDFSVDVSGIKTGDEIEELALSFNSMRENLRDYVGELKGIVEAGEKMNLALNIPFVTHAVVNALRSYFGAEAVWFAFYHEAEKKLVIEHFWSDKDIDLTGGSMAPGEGIAGKVLMTAKPIITRDLASSEFMFKEEALKVGFDAAITLPLISGGGAIGVVGLYTSQIRMSRITEKQMSLLMALANQAAVAIENARLYEETRKSELMLRASNEDLHILNRVALDMSSGLDMEELLDKIIKNAMDLVGADIGSLGLYDEEQEKVSYRYRSSIPELSMPDVIPADLGFSTTVLSSRKAVSTNDYRHDPRAVKEALELGVNAVATVPLLVGKHTLGIIQVASVSEKVFGDSDAVLLEAVGRQAAVAIENATLYEKERDIAEVLQNALLSAPDELPGLNFGLMYRAATEKARVGGDFYDFIDLPDGKIGIVIGDVSGKGLQAATATALAKMTMRAFAYEHDSPADVLAHANSVIESQMTHGQFITITYLIINPVTGRFSYAIAGHPPAAVLNRTTLNVRFLELGSTPLGAVDGIVYDSFDDEIGVDDVVLLYTDGLLEARSNGQLFGEAGISKALIDVAAIDVTDMPSAILEAAARFADDKLNDDVAVVAFSLAAPEHGLAGVGDDVDEEAKILAG